MTKMTAGHLEAVRDAAIEIACLSDREAASADGNMADYFRLMSARLSEVAAHLAAQIRENDDAG